MRERDTERERERGEREREREINIKLQNLVILKPMPLNECLSHAGLGSRVILIV